MTLNKLSELLRFKSSYKFFTCLLLVLIADFLFYGHQADGRETGWTFGIFGTLLFMAGAVHNGLTNRRKYYNIILCVVGGTCFALMENHSILAMCMYFISMIGFVLLIKLPEMDEARQLLKKALGYAFIGWWRLNRDGLVLAHIRRRKQKIRRNKILLFLIWHYHSDYHASLLRFLLRPILSLRDG